MLLLKIWQNPVKMKFLEWGGKDFDELIERIIIARKNRRPVIWSMGAHVIKNGLSRYIIELIKRGFIKPIYQETVR